ncbi:MAG: site-specific integrase [Chloroflexi bacterium]|nr:site-specific integrase [Chloroflexota bacterium]
MLPAIIDPHEPAVLRAIEQASLGQATKLKYRRVVKRYLAAGHQLTDAAALSDYAQSLSASGRAHLKAAVKLWTVAAMNDVKAVASPDNVNQVQAAVYRFEALQNAIQATAAKGQKAHIWLSQAEVKKLMGAPAGDVGGQRDRVALGLLASAGLRREEAVGLTFDDVKLQPIRGKFRTVLQIQGKGDKARVVPISDRLAAAIEAWGGVLGGGGRVLRSVDQTGAIGESLSTIGLFQIVRKYGRAIGRPELAPHDLRRTYAQIGYEAGVPITQISRLLGHANIATTQRYLNLDLDLETTISDFVPF